MDATLTQREFDTWREGDSEFKQQLVAHMAQQTRLNLLVEGRITAVEIQVRECSEGATRRTVWLSSLVSAIAGAVAGHFGGIK